MSLGAPRSPWGRAPHFASVLPAFSPFLVSSFSSMFLSVCFFFLLRLLLFPGPFVIMPLFAEFLAVVLQVLVANQSHSILVPGLGGVCDGMLAGTPHTQSNCYGRPAKPMLLQLTVINPPMVKLRPRNQNAPVNHYQMIPWGHLDKRRRYCLYLCTCIMSAYMYIDQTKILHAVM